MPLEPAMKVPVFESGAPKKGPAMDASAELRISRFRFPLPLVRVAVKLYEFPDTNVKLK